MILAKPILSPVIYMYILSFSEVSFSKWKLQAFVADARSLNNDHSFYDSPKHWECLSGVIITRNVAMGLWTQALGEDFVSSMGPAIICNVKMRER